MASTKLTRTFGSGGSRVKWTWSGWIKRSTVGSQQAIFAGYENANNQTQCKFNSSDQLYFGDESSGNTNGRIVSTAKYRDTNAWYHLVFVFDKNNSTSGDRIKMYVNGERVTSFSDTGNAPSDTSAMNNDSLGREHEIGCKNNSDFFDGVMSHIHFCDGYAYTPSDFGSTDSTTGEWKINATPSVSYGTTGYWILKDGNSVTDSSPNSNAWTVGAGTLTKTEDNPSNVFCVLNRLQVPKVGQLAMSYGNTRVLGNDSAWQRAYGTIGANSGKWWYEIYLEAADTSSRIGWDSIDNPNMGDDNYYSGIAIKNSGVIMGGINGTASYSPSNVQLPADGGGNATWSQGDYLGMGIDLDNNTITIYKNGSALATNWSYASYNTSL